MTEYTDPDPAETHDWLDSLEATIELDGSERATHLIGSLMTLAQRRGVPRDLPLNSDWANTIPADQEPAYPGDEELERKIRRILRWNAAVMVVRANQRFPGIGGHMSTYASAAGLYEVGFNHFFRGHDGDTPGDFVYFQGHASPGIYARSFLEGRLTVDQLEHFRRETQRGRGLPSYPHPRLMPDYWEFPTVSMGLGPLNAIYHARFLRYLHNRGICDTSNSRVWAFLGDGETDEPEALGALSIAYREKLDNLIFVINCNLQRLDGPVRGNGKIMQELERVFQGVGWNVHKVVWGRDWDPILAQDNENLLKEALNRAVDGEWQKYASEPGGYTREKFFGQHPETLAMVKDISDDAIARLRRGGHDSSKIYAAYDRATTPNGRPTCVLAHTVKGWTLGEGFEAKNVTHQMKKLTLEQLMRLRDRLELPIADEELTEAPFYHPGMQSEEYRYAVDRREKLGGFLPKRAVHKPDVLVPPGDDFYDEFRRETKRGTGVSTTMVFVRLLTKLLKDKRIGKHIVPIVPDEARTFGMDALFQQVGIYAAEGQKYEPIDRNMLLYYKEAKDGQLLEEGITEAGSMASFTAAGTAHADMAIPMIPFYVFYSMFGFQRVGDSIWSFADARGRGFLIGATAGRTTLNGEGLQHEDGHSHLMAATVPCVCAYDPAFAFELAMIVKEGLRRMYTEREAVFYYLTVQNENYPMPAVPEGVDAEALEEGINRGIYLFRPAAKSKRLKVQLFGSGSIMTSVLEAQELLANYGVAADIWSVTSYQQLRNDALECERWNRLHPEDEPRVPYVSSVLDGVKGPFVAASDYMKLVPEQITRWIPGRFVPLGTDGFGMSDTREALRRHFEVDAASVVLGALDALRLEGKVKPEVLVKAMADFDYDADKVDPLSI